MVALGHIYRRAFPRGWSDALRQIALFVIAYYAYRLVRGAIYDPSLYDPSQISAAAAYENARHLIDMERSLHFFVEPAVNTWASAKPWLIDIASWLYVNSQFTITLGTLVFIYRFRNGSFYFVRNMFMVAMGLALIGYLVYPTAPPRFFDEWGFRDSVAQVTHVDPNSDAVNALFNPFAAVPSMHVAFALMIGIPMSRLVRNRPGKILWACWPLVVSFAVVATANHFIIDVLLGAITAGIAALAADRLFARARPHAWAFSPDGGEALAPDGAGAGATA